MVKVNLLKHIIIGLQHGVGVTIFKFQKEVVL